LYKKTGLPYGNPVLHLTNFNFIILYVRCHPGMLPVLPAFVVQEPAAYFLPVRDCFSLLEQGYFS
jgi:hypothetical protein